MPDGTGRVTSPLPLVLVPGMACSERFWERTVARLARGDGATSAPRIRVLQVDGSDLDGAVGRLLEQAPRGPFALAGHSLGGIVAMAARRLAPERVAGLFLTATNPRPPTPEQQASWRRSVSGLRTGQTAADFQRALVPLLLSSAAQADPALVKATVALAGDVGVDRIVRQLRCQMTRVDERPGLRAGGGPVAIVAGELDALCPVGRHEEMARLSGGDLRVIPGIGHLTAMEAPDAVASRLWRWWRTADAG